MPFLTLIKELRAAQKSAPGEKGVFALLSTGVSKSAVHCCSLGGGEASNVALGTNKKARTAAM